MFQTLSPNLLRNALRTRGGSLLFKSVRKLSSVHAISERLTQLTLRIFHTSGRLEIDKTVLEFLKQNLSGISIDMIDDTHIDISKLNENEIRKIEETINRAAKLINPESTYKITIDRKTGRIRTNGILVNKDIITVIKQLTRIFLASETNVDLHKLYEYLMDVFLSVSHIKSIMIETLLTPLFIHKAYDNISKLEENVSLKNFSMRYRELSKGIHSSREIDFSEYIKKPLRGIDKYYSHIVTLLFEPNVKMIKHMLISRKSEYIETPYSRIITTRKKLQ